MAKFFWVVTIIMSLFGGLFAFVGIYAANGLYRRLPRQRLGLPAQ